MKIQGELRDITPLFDCFKPSTGQKFQLAGLLHEAAQHFSNGDAGLMLAKLEEIQEWTLKQLGVRA